MAIPDVICPYCGDRAELIDSKDYYSGGKSYGMMYICWPCDATVGIHANSKRFMPKGTLANREPRELRKQCHELFDSLWKGANAKMDREGAYRKLAENMGIPKEQAHIGMFREKQCRKMLRVFKGGHEWKRRK